MVMETPSPQCVGREFVLQYYTLLHEAPKYLHRFYSNNSSFVHGGIDQTDEQAPAIGQADIHKRIVALNFNQCHTKIRQVDSQATVSNAVVVQVSGELSNGGLPMRRFMQTFVLVPQSPKKYYVHNDIFRYQDEVFHDTESESEEIAPEDAPHIPLRTVDVESTPFYEGHKQCSEPRQYIISNGEEKHTAAEAVQESLAQEPVTLIEPPSQVAKTIVSDDQTIPEVSELPHSQDFEPQNKSWSYIAARKSAAVGVPSAAPVKPVTPVLLVQDPVTEKPQSGLPQRPFKPARERPTFDKPVGHTAEMPAYEERKRHPDSCQVFVGNLPQDIDFEKLKECFGKYGEVVDAKINRGSANKALYGFVIFSDEAHVKAVLKEKRVEYNGQRLNVEEKKRENRFNPNYRRTERPGTNFYSHRPVAGIRGEGDAGTAEAPATRGNRTGGLDAPRR